MHYAYMLCASKSSAAATRPGCAVARQRLRLELVNAAAEHQLLRRQAEEEPRRVPPLAIAAPEPEVEVVLVRRLVLREPDVAVDAHDRSVHARLGVEVGIDL